MEKQFNPISSSVLYPSYYTNIRVFHNCDTFSHSYSCNLWWISIHRLLLSISSMSRFQFYFFLTSSTIPLCWYGHLNQPNFHQFHIIIQCRSLSQLSAPKFHFHSRTPNSRKVNHNGRQGSQAYSYIDLWIGNEWIYAKPVQNTKWLLTMLLWYVSECI